MRKINAAYRLVKIFKMLYQNPQTFDDICQKLCDDGFLVNKETVGKYFKTLRKFGCVIEKKGGKFCLKSVPFSLDLTQGDFRILSLLENITLGLYGEDTCGYLKKALDKIISMADFDSKNAYMEHFENNHKIANLPEIYKEKIVKLIKLGSENSKIKIVCGSKKMTISQISFKYFHNIAYVHAFNEKNKKYELILLDDIKEITPSPEASYLSTFATSTVFALYGRLKNSYTLHEGERVISVENDRIVVSNNQEDKLELLKRLTRYSNLCKIISPQKDVEDFKEMVQQMLKNLTLT